MTFDVSNFPVEIQAATILAAATLIATSDAADSVGVDGMMGAFTRGNRSSHPKQVAALAKRILEAYVTPSDAPEPQQT